MAVISFSDVQYDRRWDRSLKVLMVVDSRT